MLLRKYDVIYLEDLRVANMVRNRHLAKRISDAARWRFRTIPEGKAAYAAVELSPCHPPTPARTAVAVERACANR
jgi:putative transposase